MAKILGLGGVFFKSPDPDALCKWYADVLGFPIEGWPGAVFQLADTGGRQGFTVWSAFKADTTYFEPSTQSFMMNFRVDDLDGFLAQIEVKGVAVLRRDDADDNGRFAWIMDPDGNKLELWEPKAA